MLRLEPPVPAKAFREYLGEIPPETEISYWGVGKIAKRSVSGYHAGSQTFHPLQNVHSKQELLKYPFPDVSKSSAVEDLEPKVRELKEQQYTVIGQMSQTILETAYEMRGLEQLMIDFCDRPDYVECLFEKIAEQRLFQASCFIDAGVDVLRIGDDIATQKNLLVSPQLYRERIRPFHASIIARARKRDPGIQVLYHSDGNLTKLLPQLIEIGVTAINPVQPECMDLELVKRKFGNELTLWGCMPTQSVFAHGSRKDVERHIRFLMDRVAPGGGLVVNFINTIMTEKVVENLRYFNEAFYQMGKY